VIVVDRILRTPAAAAGERRIFEPRQSLHAPHLLDVEVAQIVRRYPANGAIEPERGPRFFGPPVSARVLLSRIWQPRNNLTAYDVIYVALPEALDAALTRDRRLADTAGRPVRIELA